MRKQHEVKAVWRGLGGGEGGLEGVKAVWGGEVTAV